jgi:hypothetical protein
MLTEQQRLALDAATKVLQMAGISAWFEARIIKDSDKKLNGRRISSKRRTDLESVLKVADSKRVGMLPDMRMELRMYATAASSRSVVMGQELVAPELKPTSKVVLDSKASLVPRGVRVTSELVQQLREDTEPQLLTGQANYSASRNVERLRAEGLAEDHPLMKQAKRRVVREALTRDLGSIVDMEEVEHTCDAAGPMRQREPGGPFLSTCSHCGEINDDT